MPGLDRRILGTIDPETALRRIRRNVRSDLILAPHFNAIFLKAGDELWTRASEQLRSGRYHPELALTIGVLKPRGFTRPGSILQPVDRIVYQALADAVAPILDAQIDRSRTFSHVLANSAESDHMFAPERDAWNKLQERLRTLASDGGFFVKADVANYFERIPQHHLVNLMTASGCESEIVSLLEEMLLAFQERDSFGIVQGPFPSDLLGNFYLSDLDAYCDIHGIPSVRFVDDIYLHYPTHAEASRGLTLLIDQLRRDGLHLNENKSGVRPADRVLKEETALDELFAQATAQVMAERDQSVPPVLIGYGFAVDWEFDDPADDESALDEDDLLAIEVAAVERLYQSIDEYKHHMDRIEKFSLPFLGSAGSDIAVDRVLENVFRRPHLVGVYIAYLMRFLDRVDVVRRLEDITMSELLVSDQQRMYLFAGLVTAQNLSRRLVNYALRVLGDRRIAQAVRAIAAILAARHGSPQQRRAVRLAYEDEPSPYVRAALLYASRHFTSVERKTCIRAWGGHTVANALIAHVLRAN